MLGALGNDVGGSLHAFHFTNATRATRRRPATRCVAANVHADRVHSPNKPSCRTFVEISLSLCLSVGVRSTATFISASPEAAHALSSKKGRGGGPARKKGPS